MAGPTVTLTFAGDEKQLTSSMDSVGSAADTMASDVGNASSKISTETGNAADSFDKMGEASDSTETKAQGLADTIAGTTDIMQGLGDESLSTSDRVSLVATGVADLAGGFTATLIPALKSAVTWLKGTRIAALASAAAGLVVKAATAAWTAVQWLLNAALSANPIGLIIIAIIALIAGIVLLWQNSETFRDIVTAVFEAVWEAIKFVWDWISENWPLLLAILTGPIGLAVLAIITYWDEIVAGVIGVKDWIVDTFNGIVDFVTGLPGKLADAASNMWDGIVDSFKSAINFLIGLWNDFELTLGGGTVAGIDIPSVTLSTPNIPKLHSGGIVPGAPGAEVLALLQAGERVTSAGQTAAGGRMVLEIRSGGSKLDQLLVEILSKAVRERGGDVQVVLGGAR